MNINDVIDGMNIIVIIFDFYNIIKIGVNKYSLHKENK